tara:strand:- start:717 stop:1322 length:606 start_codon:yes stop_codon:yes gene_type:complete
MSSHINPDAGRLIIESIQNLDLTASQANMPAGASLYNKGGFFNSGHLYVQGTLVVNGDIITLGNSGGSLTLNSNISSDVLPDTTSGIQYNIGSTAKPWNIGYFEKIVSSQNPVTATTDVPTTKGTIYLDGSTSLSLSLANGAVGEHKTIIVTDTPAGTITVTPGTALGYTSISFAAVGDTAHLIYTSNGWSILSIFRANVT